jgi:hypothetical protein
MSDYPTDLELETIEKWECKNTQGFIDLVEFVISIWWCQYGVSWTKKKVKAKYGNDYYKFNISTGGWSGNESIISSLQRNFFYPFCFYSHFTGGHYEFHIPIMK